MQSKRIIILAAMAVIALGGSLTPAQTPPGQGGDNPGRGRPKVDLDENETPLQKGLKEEVEKRKGQGKPAPGLQSRKLDAAECPDCGDIVNPAGKVVGKRVKTRTVVDYDNPGQRREGAAGWDPIKVQKRALGRVGNGLGRAGDPDLPGSNNARLRRAVLFPDAAVNEDRDCLDRVTGERLGGYRDASGPADPSNLWADGEAGSCFDAAGALKETLVLEAGGCRHAGSGEFLRGDPSDGLADDCFDEAGNLVTSLEELIDEDGPEEVDDDNDGLLDEDPAGDADGDGNPNDDDDCIDAAGTVFRGDDCRDAAGALRADVAEQIDEDGAEPLDQDGDGRFDEDPPLAALDDACRNFGMGRGLPPGLGDLAADGTCDLTRATIAAVNRQAMAEHGRKVYQAGDDGMPDPNADGEVAYGQERRRVVLTETLTARCEDGELVDGQCLVPDPLAGAAGQVAAMQAEAATLAGEDGSPGPPSALVEIKKDVMMGFTFAPPVLEWGYRWEEYACVDFPFVGEVCFEVFFARIGYEFDMALGLRLPMEVTVSEVPLPATVNAASERTFKTTIRPLDYTAGQYREFCEANDLDDEPGIASCERFAFPNFIDSLLPGQSADEVDGDEFVARLIAFAGVIVRVVQVPVVQYGIDSAVDLPTLCSFSQIKDNNFNLLNFGDDLIGGKSLREAMKNQLADCASFTTPFGYEPDPENPLVDRLRAFPLAKSFDVRADCAEALVRGETLTIKRKTRPRCTGLFLGYNGASLGIGLGFETSIGSSQINARASASGDAGLADGATSELLRYTQSPGEDVSILDLGPYAFDNFAGGPGQDTGTVRVDDFDYLLNTIQLKIRARLQFGGILSFVPDLAALTLYNFNFPLGDAGIPIGQHAGTEGLEIPLFVENHALTADVYPASPEPADNVDADTLRVAPGAFGPFAVAAANLGNSFGDFDNLRVEISNRRDQTEPFVFGIDPNTDHDCVDTAGTIFRGNPADGLGDDCYTAAGTVRADRTELINEDPFGPVGGTLAERDEDGDGLVDEDPVDAWQVTPAADVLAGDRVGGVPPGARSDQAPTSPTQAIGFAVSPFQHPLTRPGLYPVRVRLDSLDARAAGMDAVDPSGLIRTDAEDTAFILVESFFKPEVEAAPEAVAGLPGVPRSYRLTGGNFGNDPDSVGLAVEFLDSNQAGCSLGTLGSIPDGATPGCPYRAFPTVIPAADWTDAAALSPVLGPLQPLETRDQALAISVPSNWAGMTETVYRLRVTVTSQGDPETPAASDEVIVEQTIRPTKESMTRFIGLELGELISLIETADAAGIPTGGLLPLLMRPASSNNDKALAAVLAGDFAGATRAHESNVKILEAFIHALDGFDAEDVKIPDDMAADWRQRATAMLGDLALAAASQVASADSGSDAAMP